ncbi:MAG: hypothetical protein ACK42Z_09770 [Candidatus Kapaibacteriota bacterium]
MEIRSIKNLSNKLQDFEAIKINKDKSVSTVDNIQKDTLQLNEWQKNIVDIALKYLHNKNQVENNHPLSQGRFKQIQTFEEAIEELELLRNEKLKQEGLQTQANIQPESIVSLFIQ